MSTAEFLEFLRKYIGEPLHQILIEAAHLANIAIEVAVEAGDLQDRHRRAPLVASFVSQAVQLVGHEDAEDSGPDIGAADVLVAGGRGLGEAAGFAAIEECASAFGGAVAATRAVVDAGWYPYSAQVGQTGKTVTPKLYIACGISGAIQHKVGMQGSGTIVAINKDKNAPIFDYADFGIVGDLNTIVPKLTELIKARG